MDFQAFGAEIKHERWPRRRRELGRGQQPRVFDLCTQHQVRLPQGQQQKHQKERKHPQYRRAALVVRREDTTLVGRLSR